MDSLQIRLSQIKQAYSRLLFVVGDEDVWLGARQKLADEMGFPVINLSLELSGALIGLSVKDRVYMLPEKIQELIDKHCDSDVVVIEHVEFLFEPSVGHNFIALLEKPARRKTLVVHWPGSYNGKYLQYGETGHCEYQKLEFVSGQVICV